MAKYHVLFCTQREREREIANRVLVWEEQFKTKAIVSRLEK